MEYKIGDKVMIYSRSQGRLCPAKIIGLEGDLSQHQLAKSGEKIGRGWVEVSYMDPCQLDIKDVKIADINMTHPLLPSPSGRGLPPHLVNPCEGKDDGERPTNCPRDRPVCKQNVCSVSESIRSINMRGKRRIMNTIELHRRGMGHITRIAAERAEQEPELEPELELETNLEPELKPTNSPSLEPELELETNLEPELKPTNSPSLEPELEDELEAKMESSDLVPKDLPTFRPSKQRTKLETRGYRRPRVRPPALPMRQHPIALRFTPARERFSTTTKQAQLSRVTNTYPRGVDFRRSLSETGGGGKNKIRKCNKKSTKRRKHTKRRNSKKKSKTKRRRS